MGADYRWNQDKTNSQEKVNVILQTNFEAAKKQMRQLN
jgi:hypothetical protein